jgi:hypothetical protein
MKAFIISMLMLLGLISTGFACDTRYESPRKQNYEFGKLQLTRNGKLLQDHRQDLRSEPEIETISLEREDSLSLDATPFWGGVADKYRLKVTVDAIIIRKSGLRQTNYTVEEIMDGKSERFSVIVKGSYFGGNNCNEIIKTPL